MAANMLIRELQNECLMKSTMEKHVVVLDSRCEAG